MMIEAPDEHRNWFPGAARVMSRCEELSRCSETEIGLTRTFMSPAMEEALHMVARWMREAGMTTRVDEMGNLIGGFSASDVEAKLPVWLLGSHLDTVPNAGKYDGVLGVLLAIEVVSGLQNMNLPFAIKVIGFSEEEGVRFKTPYLGSRAVAGSFDPQFLDLRDKNGISMRQALLDAGFAPDGWPLARHRGEILGYFEAHIEQGPRLESLGAPLGIVTAIAGQSRLHVRFVGQAGHAGTLPMNARRDALAAASEWILAVEKLGKATPELVATVGALEVSPGAPNVVAGETTCTLDVRHACDATREMATQELLETARQIAARRGIEFHILARTSQNAVPMNARWRHQLQRVCGDLNVLAPEMASGAGHDAAVMAELCPCAMLFLRTPGGTSHCPEEAVAPEDVALALAAMHGFFIKMAQKTGEMVESLTF